MTQSCQKIQLYDKYLHLHIKNGPMFFIGPFFMVLLIVYCLITLMSALALSSPIV